MMYWNNFTVLFSLLIFCNGCNPNKATESSGSIKGTVTKVSDGDSVDFFDGTDTIKVRLMHIDAPERFQPHSKESWQFLRKLVHNKTVFLTTDATKDRYGRIVGELYLPNKENVNQMLVEKGYAWHFKRYSTNKRYATLEQKARQNKTGLWANEKVVPPWDWRK